VLNCFSKAACELQTAYLKLHGSYRLLFLKLSWELFPGSFRKAIRNSNAALEQQEGLRKPVKILKHLASDLIKL
jgi:hypothetical protein